jgi:hypothetical protein
MSLQKINTRTVVLVLLIVAAAAMRLLSYKYQHIMSNFTPVGAIALFGGAYFADKWKAYVVVLITLFASDVLIDHLYTDKWEFWYGGAFFTYLAFAVMVFMGSLIKNISVASVGIASIASIVVHWLIIDLPWLYGPLYPHTFVGYGQSLMAAIPFERNMVLGDLVFCTLLFGGFELARRRYHILQLSEIPT